MIILLDENFPLRFYTRLKKADASGGTYKPRRQALIHYPDTTLVDSVIHRIGR